MCVCVCGCTGEWVRAKERAAHTDVKTAAAARTAATTRRPDERTERAKERMASGLRAWRSQQQHLQETASQPDSKASITQRGSDTTRRPRMTAALARMPATIEVRDEDVLTYGLRDQKVKAAVKKILAR